MGFQDEQDYIMRMIKEVIRVLVTVALGKTYKQVELDAENKYEVSGDNVNQWKKMIDNGEINEAENLLLDEMDYTSREAVEEAIWFYGYVSEKGEFLYAVTAPGLEICSQALSGQAAQLPEIQIVKPETILAKNTVSSMQAGVVYGYIGLTEKIITQIKTEIGKPMKVVATGGLGRLISEETHLIDAYDKDLTFKGLHLIYQRYLKQKDKKHNAK